MQGWWDAIAVLILGIMKSKDSGEEAHPGANELTGEGRRPLVVTSLPSAPCRSVASGLIFGMVGMGVCGSHCVVEFVFPLQYLG